MFSSLTKYSPKNLLASYLSQSLAQFFNVDPTRVKTNLIQDAKVVLNDIQIKERRLGDADPNLKISGSIEKIEFAWVWDSSSLIKDVRLTVSGVSVHVTVVPKEDLLRSIDASWTAATSVEDANQGTGDKDAPTDWRQKYMQQIIDHLTLAITDVTINIHLNGDNEYADDESLIVKAEGMELITLSNNDGSSEKGTSALMQTISLASIESWIEQEATNAKHPILEPFGYQASVTRLSGRRFLDGILSGLFVEGQLDSPHASSTIRVHAGIQQIAGLNRLQQVLLLVGQQEDRETDSSIDGTFTTTKEGSEANLSNSTATKSIFRLPFQSMEVVLENKTNLRLASCNINYSTDGAELSVNCTGGVWIGDEPLLQDSKLALDLVSSEFLLDSLPTEEQYEGDFFYSAHANDGDEIVSETANAQTNDEPLRLDLSLDNLRRVCSGIHSILPQCVEAKEMVDQAVATDSSAASTLQWSIRSTRPLSFRFISENDTWISILVKSPSVRQGLDGVVLFECACLDVASNAGFGVHVPKISTDPNGRFHVEYRITATVESIDSFKVLQHMWKQVQDAVGYESSSSGPFGCSIAGCDLTLKEPQLGVVNASCISCSGADISIGSLQVKNVKDVSFEGISLAATFDSNKTSVFLQKIKRLSFKDEDYLLAPLDSVTLTLEDDTLSVGCKEVNVRVPGQTNATQGKPSEFQEYQLPSLPFSFNLSVDHFRAESAMGVSVGVEDLNIWLRPAAASSLMADLRVKSLNAKSLDTDFSCGTINSSIEVCSASSGDGNGSEFLLPGLSMSLTSVSMTVCNVVKLSTSVGDLTKPLDVVEVTYGGGTAMVKCDKVLFRPKAGDNKTTSSRSSSSKTLSTLNLPISVYFELDRFISMNEYGPGKPGLCCDGLRVHLSPSEKSVNINAQCSYIQGRSDNQADIAIKGVKLSMLKNLNGEDELFGLQEAHLTMKEVSSLSIPGQFKLAAPIHNAQIVLRNKMIEAACNIIHVKLASAEETMGANDAQTDESDIATIPVPFSIAVEQVLIDAPASKVVCEKFSIQFMKVSPSDSQSLHVGTKSVSCSFEQGSSQMTGVSISTKWQDVTARESQAVCMPYLGTLTFAQAEVETFSDISTSMFSLIEPLHNAKLLYQDGFLVLELAEIQLSINNATENNKPLTNQQSKNAFNLDLVRIPIGFNANKLRLKGPFFDVCLNNFGVDYVPSTSNSQSEVHMSADKIVESKFVSAKHLDINLHVKTPNRTGSDFIISEIDFIKKASIKIGELSSLSVEGKGHLSQPLKNAIINYQDGILSSDIEGIQLQFYQPSLALGLRKLSVRIHRDPFDNTVRAMIQLDTISGHGETSFGAVGVSIVSTLVPTNADEVLVSKPVAIPSFGFASLIVLDIKEIPILSTRGMHLKNPINDLALRFDNGFISLDIPALILHHSADKKEVATPTDGAVVELPCKASLTVGSVQLFESFEHEIDRETRCKDLHLTLDPLKVWAGRPKNSVRGPGLGVQVIGSDFKSTTGSLVVDVPQLSVAGILQLNDLTSVGNLSIGIKEAKLAAEFSSSNWSGSAGNNTTAEIKLPFATVPKFNLTLSYVGHLVNINDATVSCDEFQGMANTTLSHLTAHYIEVVKSRIPFLLAKTDLAGCNVADSVGVMAGKMLTHTSVVGATVGVAGRDVIGSSLSLGKKSRGADANDKYQFGDFSRGVVSSVKYAAKTGSEIRGGDSYQVGDFTAGTAKAAGHYATENRCRLAGAGGSAMGMVAGAALLGPVGFVAGSFIGGSAAKTTMTAITGDPKKEQHRIEDAQGSRSQENAVRATQQPQRANHPQNQAYGQPQNRHGGNSFQNSTQQVPDLLSSTNSTQNVAQGSTRQPQHTHQQHASRVPSQAHTPQPRQSVSSHQYLAHGSTAPPPTAPPAPARNNTKADGHQGYHFGDITKGIVAKGKASDGRDKNSGYKFGDFTRGLFS